eukprot:3742693-Pyramimonas_sp.AAC.1
MCIRDRPKVEAWRLGRGPGFKSGLRQRPRRRRWGSVGGQGYGVGCKARVTLRLGLRPKAQPIVGSMPRAWARSSGLMLSLRPGFRLGVRFARPAVGARLAATGQG